MTARGLLYLLCLEAHEKPEQYLLFDVLVIGKATRNLDRFEIEIERILYNRRALFAHELAVAEASGLE